MSCNCNHTNRDHSDAHHCGGHNHSESHKSDEHRCCGHNHGEDHKSDAPHCCGHNRDHDRGCSGSCCGGQESHIIEITPTEHAFLLTLAQYHYVPLSQFLLTSTKSDHFELIALAPVYIVDGTESIAEVRERGAVLCSLEEKGLITLDYDYPLENYDYDLYHNSAAYQELEELVREGTQREGYLFDGARLETGSIALTSLGQIAIDELDYA